MSIEIVAPMPGIVAEVLVDIGDEVSTDQELIFIEAMKMEIPICSTSDGKVKEIKVKEKDKVEADQILIVLG
ncbi:MAG: acetyl-CoA carboxylase biotin carboxyl carrier protein subunit [Deltaproteobacteria bacterium]|nr:acetyl-CoA carboxylase biotin carboxyl carrier protein subunit [Deltaproteobacteria bacterium]